MKGVSERLGAYMRHLGWRRGLGLAVHRWLGKRLNPYVDLVWGSLGEDALLWFYLTEVLSIRKPGFYVDVGCNHPIYHSNTWRLYQLGWRGIAIDANQEMTDLYKKIRPRDQVVANLVSDEARELDFIMFEGSLLSTVEREHAAAWKESVRINEVRKLVPKTLTAILDEHRCPKEFELLKVDVEGHDAAVVRSIDLDKYRPIIILIEMDHQAMESIMHNEIYQKLSAHGYRMVSLAGYNGLFIKRQAPA